MIKRTLIMLFLNHLFILLSLQISIHNPNACAQNNWAIQEAFAKEERLALSDTIDISIPTNLAGGKNTIIAVPVNLDDPLINCAVSTYQFIVTFDPNILQFQNCSDAGCLTQSWEGPFVGNMGPGKISVGAFGTQPSQWSASPPPLLYLNFLIIGEPESTSSIHFESFSFDVPNISIKCHDGKITVMSDNNAAIIEVKSHRFGPGHKNQPLEVYFKNPMSVFGIQFTAKFDSRLLSCVKADTASRSARMQIVSKIWADSVRVLIFSATGDSLEPGEGVIVKLFMNVDSNAPAGDSTRIDFPEVKISGKAGKRIPAIAKAGYVSFGLKGDINNDGILDIYDITLMIDIILGNYQPTPYEFWAADMDDSGEVDIYDLIQLIEMVRDGGRPGAARPKTLLASAAACQIQLPKLSFVSGESVDLPIIASFDEPISGLQLRFKYQTDVLKILAPKLTEMTQHMNFAYNDKNGELTILIFSPEGHSFEANNGIILTLPIQSLQQIRESVPLSIDEAIAVNSHGEKIKVQFQSEIAPQGAPKNFFLGQNYPNPFNSETCIEFQIPEAGHVTLKIYNLLGEEIKTLIDNNMKIGSHKIIWDGKMNNGIIAPSGVYIYCLEHNNFKDNKKIVIQK